MYSFVFDEIKDCSTVFLDPPSYTKARTSVLKFSLENSINLNYLGSDGNSGHQTFQAASNPA